MHLCRDPYDNEQHQNTTILKYHRYTADADPQYRDHYHTDQNQKTTNLHDQKIAEKARNLIQDILSSAKEVGLIIKEEKTEHELRAQVYADGLSVGQELIYKHLAVEGQGKWCEINERD